jgi:alpha-L-rhamnosidase
MLRIAGLFCEHQINPVGLDETYPRFSWILESDEQDVTQTAYQLQVATLAGFDEIVWDTGRIGSDSSVLNEYGGPDLQPSTRYHFRVSVEDNHGNKTEGCPYTLRLPTHPARSPLYHPGPI